jgi:hypothetical protein
MTIELLDLRPITRRSNRLLTQISLRKSIYDFKDGVWIKAGECFRIDKTLKEWPSYELSAKLKDGATDGEHDSAFAFSIPLVGLEYTGVHWHGVSFKAMIDPSVDSEDGRAFNVPSADFNPFDNPKHVCTQCDDKHIFTDYLPPHDAELYKQMSGMWVDIHIGEADPFPM